VSIACVKNASVRSVTKFEQLVKGILENELLLNNGNRMKTARTLGISVRTIRNWIKKYKIKSQSEYKRYRIKK
jgi:DNA-binding NtrC family response regulator